MHWIVKINLSENLSREKFFQYKLTISDKIKPSEAAQILQLLFNFLKLKFHTYTVNDKRLM